MDNAAHISRAGDTDVRSPLYVVAHSLLTRNAQWSSLKAWGIRLAKTWGHRHAVIAVACELAVILHRMWLDGTESCYLTSITKLGGYLARKGDPPPSNMVMWRWITCLADIVLGLSIAKKFLGN